MCLIRGAVTVIALKRYPDAWILVLRCKRSEQALLVLKDVIPEVVADTVLLMQNFLLITQTKVYSLRPIESALWTIVD